MASGLRVGEGGHLLVVGEVHDLAPVGQRVEGAERVEVHVHAHEDRHGEGHGLATGLGHLVACLELAAVVLGSGGVDGQHVPVDGTTAGQGHAGHEVDLVVPEAVQAAVGHPFQGGAGVVGHHRAKGLDFVGSSGARRDGRAVAVAVGERTTGRESEAAGVQRLGQERFHGLQLVGGGLAAGGVVLHHGASNGAVADHAGHVDPEVALEAVQEVTERPPVPVQAERQGGRGHALHLDEHGGQVVGVGLVADGGDGEAAVAHDHAGDAVLAGRGGVRVPEQLGVVVGVGVDEAGADDPVAGIEGLGGLGSGKVAYGRDSPVGHANVGTHTGRSRSVDHRAARDQQVKHDGEATRRPHRNLTERQVDRMSVEPPLWGRIDGWEDRRHRASTPSWRTSPWRRRPR